MSQRDVYDILVKLGGKATTSEIKAKAKEIYPNRTLYTYVVNRLKKMEVYGYVKKEEIDGETYWSVTDIPLR